MTRILILGGGVAGLSAAAELAGEAEVTLVEAEPQLGYHASGRSAAAFIEDYGNATVQVLNRATLPHLQDIPDLLRSRVMMMVSQSQDAEAFAHEAADLGMDPIDKADGLPHFPILDGDRLTHIARRDDGFDVDTGLLLNTFQARARRAGAQILTKAPVTAIRREGATWRVTAGAHEVIADLLVNAAGAWADELAAMAGIRPIGLQPHRRSMARVAAPDGHDITNWAFIINQGETFYAKPDAGALLVSPAEADPVPPQDAWAEDMVLAEGIAAYEDFVTEPVTRMIANWAGLRSFVSDGALVLGPDPDEPAFVWAAAQGGYGFQTSFGAARLLRARILGQAPEISAEAVAALSPDRLR